MRLTASFNENTCVVKSISGSVFGEIEYEDKVTFTNCIFKSSQRILHLEQSTMFKSVRKVTEEGNSVYTTQRNTWSGATAIEPLDYRVVDASEKEPTKLTDADGHRLLTIKNDMPGVARKSMSLEVSTDVDPVLILLTLHQHILGS
ncbi:hypothetical protein SAMN05216480_101371 [Pustulibacterium marinum]|uniref:Uncharacterized protein n=1 Tax=Pustulibacterium marinum TaxID=1224947 RepID=A0A1I7EX74_9FLAO|nr:hypothetical protein [Pustulibacterium marinum]SFU28494.1 hypothetical protein SAMN05216480_101371 [Pustulibacterium marinum]